MYKITSLTIKKENDTVNFLNVNNFNLAFGNGVFNFSNYFGELKVILIKEDLFISSGDCSSAFLSTLTSITSGKTDLESYISLLSLRDEPSQRECKIDFEKIEIKIGDIGYVVYITQGKVFIHSSEYCKIMIKPLASNAVLFSSVADTFSIE